MLQIADGLKSEDAKQEDTSDCDSELAENLVQKTYVEKKADRLIKEFQTESDDEAEIEEVKSAVKQQIEIEERKMTGDIDPLEEEKTEPASVEKDQAALPQPPQESADTPQAADKITGSSARESQNSSV